MRFKIFFSIVAIVAVILTLGVSASLFVSENRLRNTLENDMSLVARLASRMVSNRLWLLKSESRNLAREVNGLAAEDLRDTLESVLDHYDYLSAAVLEHGKWIASAGIAPMRLPDPENDAYVHAALRGEIVIAPLEMEGDNLVFKLYVAIGKRVLILSVPGLIISDLLWEFDVLESGNIFVVDKNGAVLAYRRLEAMLQRWNFVHLGEYGANYQGMATTIRRMIGHETGIGYYAFDGVKRMCAFLPVLGSDGWSLGVVAPLHETALFQVRDMLLLTGVVLLTLGTLAAFLATRLLIQPFETIERQNQSLVELKRAADQASEAKSRFIANTSHEIRTPLNSIIGFSELALGQKDLPEEVESHLEKIYNAGVELLGIINDLLDISKIEADKFELIPVVYDVPSMINDTRSLNLLRIVDKPIRFILSVDSAMPCKLRGDEIRIKQIFNNLLSNAFKYTREGEVEWSLSNERDGDAVWLTSRVRDSGIGIREEDIGKLFMNYSQVDTRSNRKIEGTGLGLSITKKLVEMMQGTIRVESRYGEGSTFIVRVRQGFVSDEILGAEAAGNLEGLKYAQNKRKRTAQLVRIKLPRARVLVVDDVKTNLDVARGVMKPYGMRVDCVQSGAEAVRAVREEKVRYDAIFMDHMMPEMDGIEATRLIRETIGTEYAQTVPIIALTANAIVGNEEMFLKSGFQAFLSKPIDIMLLDAVLRRWMRGAIRHEEESAPDEPVAAPGTPHFIDGLDWEKGCQRFGGDEAAYVGILRSYATNTTELLEKIREPDAQTLPDYAIVVHGIKGSSNGIGADRVGRCAEALEQAARNDDMAFVREKNPELVERLETLLKSLSALIGADAEKNARERRERPDENLLRKMYEAARDFDVDAMTAALRELEGFRYVEGEELVRWLRQGVAHLKFVEIRQRLSADVPPEVSDSDDLGKATNRQGRAERNGKERHLPPVPPRSES
ncbi:MAG: response regulator [Candidatus Accumulibacter sp.]|jgi:signal transduction histidine kinase/CheY-like chemotaxis protein|nr:response regulator [Accumulibacter sp.]